ncbi:HD domain-containing phosphohydrolase [Anaeroselena agilis]|uniref:HD-GYP domain-containing protein n=1 Tax=Anaeroselena agilis TaxID=3063788 RepID=A0ABU3P3G1_9FIRM|nr:HD-GYP domain-containing protein [Selenomonadales bacterium 4137-cl]
MKTAAVPLCLFGIALSIIATTKYQLAQRQGLDNIVLLQGAGFLLLMIVAYVVFAEYRAAARVVRPENPVAYEALRPLFMYMPGAVVILKKDFTIIDANELVLRVTGMQLQAVRGKKCYEVLGNGELCGDCLVQKAFVSGRPESGAKLKYDRNGRQKYGQQTVIPVKDRHGNIEQVFEIVTDITQEVSLEMENLQSLMDIVTSMVHLIESRDPPTKTHSANVQSLALSIGKHIGLGDNELKELSIAAILHDIGKICIPEPILNKPERLTDAEFSIIRRHPQIGYDALKHIGRLQNVSDAIRDHHEHFDGRGYPHGRKKDEISVLARIIAVADVFEALTSDRVYRKAMSVEQAIAIIQAGRERQFDPIAVDALLAVTRKK